MAHQHSKIISANQQFYTAFYGLLVAFTTCRHTVAYFLFQDPDGRSMRKNARSNEHRVARRNTIMNEGFTEANCCATRELATRKRWTSKCAWLNTSSSKLNFSFWCGLMIDIELVKILMFRQRSMQKNFAKFGLDVQSPRAVLFHCWLPCYYERLMFTK
jgi:hypothetical protein